MSQENPIYKLANIKFTENIINNIFFYTIGYRNIAPDNFETFSYGLEHYDENTDYSKLDAWRDFSSNTDKILLPYSKLLYYATVNNMDELIHSEIDNIIREIVMCDVATFEILSYLSEHNFIQKIHFKDMCKMIWHGTNSGILNFCTNHSISNGCISAEYMALLLKYDFLEDFHKLLLFCIDNCYQPTFESMSEDFTCYINYTVNNRSEYDNKIQDDIIELILSHWIHYLHSDKRVFIENILCGLVMKTYVIKKINYSLQILKIILENNIKFPFSNFHFFHSEHGINDDIKTFTMDNVDKFNTEYDGYLMIVILCDENYYTILENLLLNKKIDFQGILEEISGSWSSDICKKYMNFMMDHNIEFEFFMEKMCFRRIYFNIEQTPYLLDIIMKLESAHGDILKILIENPQIKIDHYNVFFLHDDLLNLYYELCSQRGLQLSPSIFKLKNELDEIGSLPINTIFKLIDWYKYAHDTLDIGENNKKYLMKELSLQLNDCIYKINNPEKYSSKIITYMTEIGKYIVEVFPSDFPSDEFFKKEN